MNKIEQREAMKKLAILNVGIDAARFAVETTNLPFGFITALNAKLEIERKTQAILMTPAKYFRTDKPEIDKRRQRRFTRKIWKHITIGKPMIVSSTPEGVSVGYRIHEELTPEEFKHQYTCEFNIDSIEVNK